MYVHAGTLSSTNVVSMQAASNQEHNISRLLFFLAGHIYLLILLALQVIQAETSRSCSKSLLSTLGQLTSEQSGSPGAVDLIRIIDSGVWRRGSAQDSSRWHGENDLEPQLSPADVRRRRRDAENRQTLISHFKYPLKRTPLKQHPPELCVWKQPCVFLFS